MPGLEVKPLLDELRKRVAEELDYTLEAVSQEAFADAYADDPDFCIPHVVAATEHVLVSEWMDGTPLAKIIAEGSSEERNRAGVLLVRFLFSGPARAGLLHADPHPGNFRLLDDGRLGVLDFGAVDRLPDGFPPFFGKLLRLVHEDRDIETVEHELRANGFLKEDVNVDLDALHAYLAPLAEPSRVESFKFNREWLRAEASRVTDIRSAAVGRRLNLPPSYVLIHRVSTAGIGVLCQLECEGEFRAEVLRWIPGYLDEAQPALAEDGLAPPPGRTSRRDDLGRTAARTTRGTTCAPPPPARTTRETTWTPPPTARTTRGTTSAPRPQARAARQPDPPGSSGPRPFCGARGQAGWPCHAKAPGG